MRERNGFLCHCRFMPWDAVVFLVKFRFQRPVFLSFSEQDCEEVKIYHDLQNYNKVDERAMVNNWIIKM